MLYFVLIAIFSIRIVGASTVENETIFTNLSAQSIPGDDTGINITWSYISPSPSFDLSILKFSAYQVLGNGPSFPTLLISTYSVNTTNADNTTNVGVTSLPSGQYFFFCLQVTRYLDNEIVNTQQQECTLGQTTQNLTYVREGMAEQNLTVEQLDRTASTMVITGSWPSYLPYDSVRMNAWLAMSNGMKQDPCAMMVNKQMTSLNYTFEFNGLKWYREYNYCIQVYYSNIQMGDATLGTLTSCYTETLGTIVGGIIHHYFNGYQPFGR